MSIATTGDRLEVITDPVGADRPEVADGTPGQQPGTNTGRGAEVLASARPSFTITDAATSCSVSRKTITRKLPELAGHGAAKDDDGVWRIPVEALLAVGLHPGRSLPEVTVAVARHVTPPPAPARSADQETVTISRDRWDDVRIRLARAEAEAAERGLALADARLALRALTAGPVTSRTHAATGGGRELHPTGAPGEIHPPTTTGAPPAPLGSPRPDEAPAAGGPAQATLTRAAPAVPTVPDAPGGHGAPVAANEGADVVPADVVAARNLAARTGGYVPAEAAPAKKRRWWQSH